MEIALKFFTEYFDYSDLAEHFSRFADNEVLVSSGDACFYSSPYEEERALVERSVSLRRAEFFSGRYYAREALRQAGCVSGPILRGEKGNPLWPRGVVGSITHDLQKVIAVVARDSGIGGIGIDLIMAPSSIESHLQPFIARDLELHALKSFSSSITPLALAFGLKEAVVKAVSPNIDRYLDLLDIYLSFEDGSLIARLPQFEVVLQCAIFKLKEGFVSFAVMKNYQ